MNNGIMNDWKQFLDQNDKSLQALSDEKPMLLVFLRHMGCIFSHEALADLSRIQDQIASQNVRLGIVHMSECARAEEMLKKYGLKDVAQFSDPEKKLYEEFELRRGSPKQLFGPKVLWRGLQALVLEGHFNGKIEGDGFQLAGVFLIHKGKLLKSFRHRTAGDRPDYLELARVDS